MGQLMDSLISRLSEYFAPENLGAFLAEFLVTVIIVGIVAVAFYIVWRIMSRVAVPRLQRRLDRTSAAFAETVVKFGIFGIGVLVALNAAGVETAALLGSLGVVGLTLGFALRDTLSNIVAGILIFVDRPFTIDDLVDIDGDYGRVDRISLRTTRIVTNDGRMLAVPNSEVMNKTVASYTNFPHLRLDIEVTVAVTESLDQVRQVLLSIVENDPEYLTNPGPRMVVTKLNDYNVAVELQAWLRDERQHVSRRAELRERVFTTLTSAGIEMPFETIQLAPHRVTVLTAAHSANPTEHVPPPIP